MGLGAPLVHSVEVGFSGLDDYLGSWGELFAFVVSEHAGDFQDVALVRVEARHLEVNPEERGAIEKIH